MSGIVPTKAGDKFIQRFAEKLLERRRHWPLDRCGKREDHKRLAERNVPVGFAIYNPATCDVLVRLDDKKFSLHTRSRKPLLIAKPAKNTFGPCCVIFEPEFNAMRAIWSETGRQPAARINPCRVVFRKQ